MKKKIAFMLAGTLTVSMLLSGCQQSQGLETDDLTITQYKGVEVDQVEKPEEVTDETVETYIDNKLQSNAVSVDREVKDGDIVNIDYVGKMDGEEFDGGSAEGYDLTIGSDSFIDGFEDSIIGHKKGDTFDWNGQFPDPYENNPDFAGKDVVFTITVNDIQEIPELTDEVVATLSDESKTVAEYKKEVKEQLEEFQQYSYEQSLSSEVWTKVLENTEVKKYPEDEKEKQEKELRELYEEQAAQADMEFADYLQQTLGMDEDTFTQQAAQAVESNIKYQMVTEAIADKENIKLDDKTYEERVKELADLYGMEVSELEEQMTEDDLKEKILYDMVSEFLCDKCVQVASSEE